MVFNIFIIEKLKEMRKKQQSKNVPLYIDIDISKPHIKKENNIQENIEKDIINIINE